MRALKRRHIHMHRIRYLFLKDYQAGNFDVTQSNAIVVSKTAIAAHDAPASTDLRNLFAFIILSLLIYILKPHT